MTESAVANRNATWAGALLDRLYEHGVRDLCLAPGSRSAPLALAAARRADSSGVMTVHTHYDERGLGFFALGLIRATGRPVAVITTSGTAVPNLHPAMAEAWQSCLPLIAVTADRPPELHDCGANQAIPQEGVFSPHVRTSLNLPAPEAGLSTAWLAGRLDSALAAATAHTDPSPIHLNVPFREPLYGGCEETADNVPALPRYAGPPAPVTLPAPTPPLLLVAGQLAEDEAEAALAAAEKTGIPILADLGSQLRLRQHPCVIDSPELLLATPTGRAACAKARQVIQLGGRLTGKRLPAWLAAHAPRRWLVSRHRAYLDPDWQATAVQTDIPSLCQSLPRTRQAPLPGLAEAVARVRERRRALVPEGFAEPAAAARLSRLLPTGMTLFAGNSLPVRALDLFAETGSGNRCLTQRGASGIDGLIATAAGHAVRHPTTLMIGDLSALHDLNSLALFAAAPQPCIAVVLNNDGGGIFDLLPAHHEGEAHRRLFRMPHGLDFAEAAAQFGLPYWRCEDVDGLEAAYTEALAHGGGSVIEAVCPPGRGSAQITALLRALETKEP
ncbi:MAG: 2-succinyl-5-enolpyruvyl-6-hydroxy-3-cyclohexene-1-carboxylic-acid synthase [Halorhodospira sp.]